MSLKSVFPAVLACAILIAYAPYVAAQERGPEYFRVFNGSDKKVTFVIRSDSPLSRHDWHTVGPIAPRGRGSIRLQDVGYEPFYIIICDDTKYLALNNVNLCTRVMDVCKVSGQTDWQFNAQGGLWKRGPKGEMQLQPDAKLDGIFQVKVDANNVLVQYPPIYQAVARVVHCDFNVIDDSTPKGVAVAGVTLVFRGANSEDIGVPDQITDALGTASSEVPAGLQKFRVRLFKIGEINSKTYECVPKPGIIETLVVERRRQQPTARP